MATKTRQLADFLVAGGVSDAEIQSVPHIRPGILCPAIAGKLLDGTTSHSGAYGTAQSDGKSYYYTDIKGSGPIKDPRIGAHFGGQRHKFSSIQVLEQETATHGQTIYSIDGRNWCRVSWGQPDNNKMYNSSWGQYIQFDTGHSDNTDWIEVTGYFSSLNILVNTDNNQENFNVTLDGTANSSVNALAVVNTSPLGGRYVSASSVVNVVFDSAPTLGIHTVKIGNDAGYMGISGIEFIAQDTSSTANRSKIQIPSQNVVSYGKKFTVSGTPHYDPFNGFTNSSSLHSAFVDTATSLGLDSAPGSSASWAISSTNNIRPYNGGRVVIWVDSSGTIKTSVNMMPPNAQNIAGSNAGTTEVTTPSATNVTYTPIFSDDAIDHSLSEVAKTFHWREFGNGAANGGTGATYADASMLSSGDDIAYVMDDGLTSLSADGATWNSSENFKLDNNADKVYITFIGTGLTIINGTGTIRNVAQNLPYGTHIFRIERTSSSAGTATIDGIAVQSTHANWDRGIIWSDITFHQPKKPPIPEDAVVLADYMLMADHVKVSAAALEDGHVSKGTRLVSARRDIFYDNPTGAFSPYSSHGIKPGHPLSLRVHREGAFTAKLPFFGTTFMVWLEGHSSSGYDIHSATLGGSSANLTHVNNTGSALTGHGDMGTSTTSVNLGLTEVGFSIATHYNIYGIGVISPIHTSSHYQTFETPFLHELVGGDRNMEQTNLVVTPDGKTWDEVTRDTSYIGNVVLQLSADVGEVDYNVKVLFDECRGFKTDTDKAINTFNKDFAIAYDRVICLVDGEYRVHFNSICMAGNNQYQISIHLNGNVVSKGYGNNSTWGKGVAEACVHLKRGDQIYIQGGYWDNGGVGHSGFYIERLK